MINRQTNSSPKHISRLAPPAKSENIVVAIILLFPCMGTFFAPETYFTPLEFSIQAARQPVENGILFGRITFILLFMWLIQRYIQSPRVMFKALLRSSMPLIFVCWMIASASWTLDPTASFNRSLRIFIIVLFAIYIIERYDHDSLIKMLTIISAIAIVTSIASVIVIPNYAYSGLVGYESAWRGATMHKNSLGALMTVVFLFGYYSLFTKRKIQSLSVFVILGSLALIVMSQSATSVLVIILTCALIVGAGIINSFHIQSEKIFILIMFVGLIIINYFIFTQIDGLFLLLGRDASFTGRADVWNSVSDLISQRPMLGHGYGFWAIESLHRDDVWAEVGWAAPTAHNTFLDIRLQLGLVGVAIAACLFAIMLCRSVRLIMLNVPPAALIWPLIFFTTLLRGFSETYLVDMGGTGLFWCTLAFAALGKLVADHRPTSQPHQRTISHYRNRHRAVNGPASSSTSQALSL